MRLRRRSRDPGAVANPHRPTDHVLTFMLRHCIPCREALPYLVENKKGEIFVLSDPSVTPKPSIRYRDQSPKSGERESKESLSNAIHHSHLVERRGEAPLLHVVDRCPNQPTCIRPIGAAIGFGQHVTSEPRSLSLHMHVRRTPSSDRNYLVGARRSAMDLAGSGRRGVCQTLHQPRACEQSRPPSQPHPVVEALQVSPLAQKVFRPNPPRPSPSKRRRPLPTI